MWTSRYKRAIGLMVILLPLALQAQEREKQINRSFEVGSNTELKVENKFGRIHINTWEQNKIEVEVVVKADMRSISKAQEFIDRVEIEISESPSLISLETDYGSKMSSQKGESFSVDYTINMPSSNPLRVSNKFGDIYVGDLSGDVDIDLKHGNLKGDRLTGEYYIEMGFSSGSVLELGNGEVNSKYSKLSIEKTQDMDLDQQFSEIEVDELQDLDLRSKYGEVELGTVKSVKGDVAFTDFEIEELTESADLDMEYVGGFRISRVHQGFKEIRLDAKFTSMDLRLVEGVNGKFEGVFRFSDLDARTDALDLNYVVKDMNRNEYKGKIGSGGSALIWVNTSYGDLGISSGS